MKLSRIFWLSTSVMLFAHSAWAEVDEGTPPQMDMAWFPNQLLWLAVSFLVLYLVVSRFIAPSVAGVLQTRESAIADAIAEAERAKREAESTKGSAASSSNAARMQAAEFMAKAQAENSKDAADAIAKLDHELERKANHAEAVLVDALAKAHSGVEQASDDLAAAIAAKLLGQSAPVVDSAPKLKLAKS